MASASGTCIPTQGPSCKCPPCSRHVTGFNLSLKHVLFSMRPTRELGLSSQGRGTTPSCYGPGGRCHSRPQAPGSLCPYGPGSPRCPRSLPCLQRWQTPESTRLITHGPGLFTATTQSMGSRWPVPLPVQCPGRGGSAGFYFPSSWSYKSLISSQSWQAIPGQALQGPC